MKLMIRRASVRWIAGTSGGARVVASENTPSGPAPSSSLIPRRGKADTRSAELIAAAHAGSFSLALAQELGRAALSRGIILTSVAVTLERFAAGWTIGSLHLDVVARLPNVEQGRFIDAAVRAKTNCLVSRVVRATISMNARLEH